MAAAIAAGFVLDRLFGDPRRLHPVAAFGLLASALERRVWRPNRSAGAAYALSLVAATAALAAGLERAFRGHLVWRGLLIWTTLGGRTLERAALSLGRFVTDGDLDRARELAPTLVGRDPSQLDAAELCRAAVESVAENTSDAVVAPLLWAGLLGAPGAAAYRAANTLDAMVGHRSERYEQFGWAAARLDDAVNWPAARLTALLAIVGAPIVGGASASALRVAFTDGRAHPSPNAGRVEGAFAGALNVQLGGLNRYSHGAERRATLGTGPPPVPADIDRAVALARVVDVAAVAVCAALAAGIAR